MAALTAEIGTATALDRHERRRGEGTPVVSVLVGERGPGLVAARRWADGHGRNVITAFGAGLEALARDWVCGLEASRDCVADALGWLAREQKRSAEELAAWFARATPHEVERFLDAFPGDSACDTAIACTTILRQAGSLTTGSLAERFAPAYARVPVALCALAPAEARPVLVAEPDPRSLEAVADGLARIAEASPWLTLVVLVAASDFEAYREGASESRSKAIIRAGVVPVAGLSQPGTHALLAAADDRWAATVRRLVADGVTHELAESFTSAAAVADNHDDVARSAAERFLFDRLESLAATTGLFALNAALPIEFGAGRAMEVDLWSGGLGLAVEIDGYYHFQNADAYRRDRRKDWTLQRHGHLVVRVLAEDVVERLDDVLDLVLEAVATRRGRLRGERS